MGFRRTMLVIICWLTVITVYPQFRLPQFDVELKAHQNIVPGNGSNGGIELFEATNLYSALHIQISQHLGIGAYYSKSLRGMAKYHDDQLGSSSSETGELLLKGLDIRLSTGRSKNWRKYMSLNYSKIEIVEDNVDFRYAAKTNAFGASIGIMRKLGNKLYLTVIEVGAKSLSDKPFWFGLSDNIMLDVKMGLLYNFDRRK